MILFSLLGFMGVKKFEIVPAFFALVLFFMCYANILY